MGSPKDSAHGGNKEGAVQFVQNRRERWKGSFVTTLRPQRADGILVNSLAVQSVTWITATHSFQ